MHKIILIIFVMVIIGVVAGLFTAEYYTSQPSFCGSCHIMKQYYDSWSTSKHNQVACVECHYAPGEHKTVKAKFKGLGQLFTYLALGDTEVRKPAIVSDLSCTKSECHPTTGKGKGEYWTKKISFVEYVREDKSKAVVSITHEAHFDKNKWVPGQELHCSTCHWHEYGKKHMEVSWYICYLCHFKNVKVNEGRAKCSLCHAIPEKPFKKTETPDEKPVTHKELEERKVSCASCHLHLIKGHGMINDERCLFCHQYDERLLNDAKNFKLMHEKHVAAQTAHCFNCHERIQHKKSFEDFNYVDAGLANCMECHPEPHLYQRLLIAGEGGIGIDQTYPIQHHNVKTNCIACHKRDAFDEKGRKIKSAESGACVACHTENEGNLAKKWQSDVAEYLTEARGLEKKAIEEIEIEKGNIPDIIIRKAKTLLKDGQENLRIVDAGGGVHNKKYAMLLLETAVEKFEEAIEEVKGGNK